LQTRSRDKLYLLLQEQSIAAYIRQRWLTMHSEIMPYIEALEDAIKNSSQPDV